MIEGLPNWINVVFLLTVVFTVLMFYYANGKRAALLAVIILWSVLQSMLAYTGFYQITNTLPPRFALVLLPATILIIVGLLPKYRNLLMKDRNLVASTFLHSARIPVEIVLYYLFIHKMIPELMTFAGRNFDILAGLTAPVIGLLILTKKVGNSLLMIWTLVGLCLVTFILINGILSSELPFQQFGFEQPNKAINYFPFILLPAVIVPIVIYTHITDLLLLRSERKPGHN